MRTILILALLALSSCVSAASAPVPRGDVVPLNPSKWQATTNDLTTPPYGEMR